MTRLSASQKMRDAADRMAGEVDRVRLTDAEKALRATLIAKAEAIAAFPAESETEALTVLHYLARAVHGRIIRFEGQHKADTLFAAIARRGAVVPNHARDKAREAGEALFGAND